MIKVHTSNPNCHIGRSFGGPWSASSQLTSNSDGGSYGHTEQNLDHEEKSNSESTSKSVNWKMKFNGTPQAQFKQVAIIIIP